ncbi:MAG: MBL fold metallo-hydrolase [Eggerthellaceae bacterium]|nr:MBL fold metallo-hydrolase [Eggerthellaceae bacterium]
MAAQVYPLLARGVFATYGYFVMDSETRHGFLIDPGAQPQLFLQAIRENGWTIEAVLLTHGHFDHTGAVNALRDELGTPVMAHELADRYLLDARLNLSAEHGRNVTVPDTVKFADGDRIALSSGDVALGVLHVPGHTDDSCALYCEQAGFAIVGDTVYEGGPGLTVFPTGDAARLRESIQSKLFALPGDTVLLSGHSRPMTVAQLRQAVRYNG